MTLFHPVVSNTARALAAILVHVYAQSVKLLAGIACWHHHAHEPSRLAKGRALEALTSCAMHEAQTHMKVFPKQFGSLLLVKHIRTFAFPPHRVRHLAERALPHR